MRGISNGVYHERLAKRNGFKIVIGVDEVGRGPLAGPVVVAASWLHTWAFKERITDSKKLSALERQRAFDEIKKKGAYGIGVVYEDAVDAINITQAAKRAADVAVSTLISQLKTLHPSFQNTFLLFDGSLSSSLGYFSKEIIGGDGKSLSIASASIIAKVFRDQMMEFYDALYPRYGFKDHKGYGTRMHLKNISRFGLCSIHRKTFCRFLKT
jgi:ribonuclease HII